MARQPVGTGTEIYPLFKPDEFGLKVAERMAAKGLTIRDAAAQIGVSRNALHRVTQGKTPEVETYLRITKWMET